MALVLEVHHFPKRKVSFKFSVSAILVSLCGPQHGFFSRLHFRPLDFHPSCSFYVSSLVSGSDRMPRRGCVVKIGYHSLMVAERWCWKVLSPYRGVFEMFLSEDEASVFATWLERRVRFAIADFGKFIEDYEGFIALIPRKYGLLNNN